MELNEMPNNFKIIYLFILMFSLTGCVELMEILDPGELSNNWDAKSLQPQNTGTIIIAWSGLYEIDGNNQSYFHKAYQDISVKNSKSNYILKNMIKYFMTQMRFKNFHSRKIASLEENEEDLNLDKHKQVPPDKLYSLILVPTFEMNNYHLWGQNTHTNLLYAGISALIVKPGPGRIVAVASGLVTRTLKSTDQKISEIQLVEEFRKLYADAAAVALTNLQEKYLHLNQNSSSIITDIFVEDSRLRSLFKIKGKHLDKRTCLNRACQELNNIAAEMAAHKLLSKGQFVLPPFTGMSSKISGSHWATKSQRKMVNLIGVNINEQKPIRININIAEANRFVAVYITSSSAVNTSEEQNYIIEHSIAGKLTYCTNRLTKTQRSQHEKSVISRLKTIYCNSTNESGTLLRFDNSSNPTEYLSYLSPPTKKDHIDNFLGSIINALNE